MSLYHCMCVSVCVCQYVCVCVCASFFEFDTLYTVIDPHFLISS